MHPLGIHHVAIMVRDTASAVEFYTGVLGLTLNGDRPELGVAGAWLDVGGQQVHLVERPGPESCGQHFAIRVADLDATIAAIRARGIDVGEVRQIGPGRQALLNDPSGNLLELHEPEREGVVPASA